MTPPIDNSAPQANPDLEVQEQIVAALCAEAPDAVRDCLRKYDPKKTEWQIKAAFKQQKKPILVQTLGYLGLPDMEKFKADALPHELLCRVQNLFPDVCHLCKQKYCVKLNDKPIISCASCGQGCHNACVLQMLGISEEDLNAENNYGSALLNPYASVGLVYMCEGCQEEVLPQKNKLIARNGAKRSTKAPQSVNSSEPNTVINQTRQTDETVEQTEENSRREAIPPTDSPGSTQNHEQNSILEDNFS